MSSCSRIQQSISSLRKEADPELQPAKPSNPFNELHLPIRIRRSKQPDKFGGLTAENLRAIKKDDPQIQAELQATLSRSKEAQGAGEEYKTVPLSLKSSGLPQNLFPNIGSKEWKQVKKHSVQE